MGVGEISILRQRVLTIRQTVPSAARFVNISTSPNSKWPRGWSGTKDRALVAFASAAKNAAVESVTNILTPAAASARADPMSASTLPVSAASARSKKLRACVTFSGVTPPIEPSQTLKIKVHRVRGRGLFRASRLSGDELGLQRACQPRNNFVLHVEEVGHGPIEALGPEMIAFLCAYELHIDAHAVAATP